MSESPSFLKVYFNQESVEYNNFHPHMQEAIEILGQKRFEHVEQERSMRYPIYREHTRILFENFLAIGTGHVHES